MTTQLEKLHGWQADTAIVLGSGLGAVASNVEETIPYSQFAEMPRPSVPGHAGRFELGKVGKARIIFAQGRIHLYEGFSGHEVTAAIRILARAGIKVLLLTNAAGSVNPKFSPGEWMLITDHINLTGTSPLLGSPFFLDQSEVYSSRLRQQFTETARRIDLTLHRGVYAGLLGPEYETPAEVRMLQKLGADAVGMSTVLEAIQARALGLEIAAFSCLTNFGAGITRQALSHEEVLTTGKKAAADFARLLTAALT